MNRLEEFQELKYQTHTPSALDDVVERELQHYYSYQKKKRYLYYPIVSIITFILLLTCTFNLFPHTAYACKNIPILETFAKTLCFNQTVKDCLENNYAIYIHHTDKDMTLEYIIVDETQMTFYIRCDSIIPKVENIHFIDSGKGYSIATSYNSDNLIKIQAIYDDIENIEFSQALTLTIDQNEYSFPFSIQKEKIQEKNTYHVDQTITVDGQTIDIQKIEIYPSSTRIYVYPDEKNTLKLANAYFYMTSPRGEYTLSSGITGLDVEEHKVYIIGSPYFQNNYALYLKSLSFVSPEYEHCLIDGERKTIEGLPEGVKIDDFLVENDRLKMTLRYENHNDGYFLVNEYYMNDQKYDLDEKNITVDDQTIRQIIDIPYDSKNQYDLHVEYQQYYEINQQIKINK